jgi:N-acetylglucosamine kinase-like BadF-type ATPase
MTTGCFVAIDGGNSKTHLILGTAGGEVLAFVTGPGSSPHHLGLPASMDLLSGMVIQALAIAGLPADAVLDRAELYIAGADLPIEVEILGKAMAQTGWARECRVDNDLFALLRAGTSALDAVAVVCGAGINCVGRTADGRTARFPALGTISGDWGGGHELAQQALWHAARGEDGRGPQTALTPAVAAHFGQSTVEQVSAGLHLGEVDGALLPELSPLLFRVADAGDPVARSVVARQADEIVALATVAARRLNLLDREHAVVLGGGVLAAHHPLLHDAVVAGILTVAPRADIGSVVDPPVAGAALLALDELGATDPATEARLRAAARAHSRP